MREEAPGRCQGQRCHTRRPARLRPDARGAPHRLVGPSWPYECAGPPQRHDPTVPSRIDQRKTPCFHSGMGSKIRMGAQFLFIFLFSAMTSRVPRRRKRNKATSNTILFLLLYVRSPADQSHERVGGHILRLNFDTPTTI